MGGHALQTIITQRLDAPAYHALAERALCALSRHWPGARPHVVRSYRAKADFGDIDIIVDASGVTSGVEDALRVVFGAREIVRNGNVWSCDFEGFQVDVIVMPAEDYATAIDYYAWNDAGNLIGRIARRMGFKYGHRGLHYVLRDGDHLIAEVQVCRDVGEIFRFLGFDHAGANYAAFQAGFGRLADMFQFVASSRYFDRSAYALEARNHVARIRDRKRPSYRAFLEWLASTPAQDGPDRGFSRAYHLERARKRFPAFADALADAEREHATRRARREKFNGALVRAWTGLNGKSLGNVMAACRNQYGGGASAFDTFLDYADPDAVRQYVVATARLLESDS